MKKIRDWLIVIVLGGVVVLFLARAVRILHDKSVVNNMTVHEAEIASLNDRFSVTSAMIHFPQSPAPKLILKARNIWQQ